MKHILLCTDGSIFAQNSYRYAAWLAPRLDACVDVLNVTDIRSQKAVTTGDLSGSIGIDASKELLNKLVEIEHEKAKINHQRAKLILQEPETVIARYVEDKDISLLAMGAYGHSRIRHLVIGSTTAQLLRSSHIPVLLFR